MSESLSMMARKIRSATELHQVVRTMKTLAAVNIPIYDRAVASLAEYERAIESGLVACFHDQTLHIAQSLKRDSKLDRTAIVAFGSDRGLVGDFNEKLALFCAQHINQSEAIVVWPVGERIFDELSKQKLVPRSPLRAPDSVPGIRRVISELLMDFNIADDHTGLNVRIFHNRPVQGRFYEPTQSVLLPLDEAWLMRLRMTPWPNRVIPQVFDPPAQTWAALIREYLFVHLFRACAESLASENISRFASMRRAEKNIREALDRLRFQYNQQRQNSIDDELFDVVVGAEAAAPIRKSRPAKI